MDILCRYHIGEFLNHNILEYTNSTDKYVIYGYFVK